MFEGEDWFSYLELRQQALVKQAWQLLEEEEEKKGRGFDDYGFVIFPIAKAYEGFLKKLLFEMGLIDERLYKSDHFRIGRSLNPDLPEKYRDEEWVYGRLADVCGEELARQLWRAWKEGRNLVFHYFLDQEAGLTRGEAREKVEQLKEAMRKSFGCLVSHRN